MNLKENRLAVAIVLVPMLYLLVRTLPPFLFFLLATAAILRVQYEFYQLFYQNRKPICVGLGLGFLLLLFYYMGNLFPFFPLVCISILAAVFIFHLFYFQDIKTTLVDSAVLFLGTIYLPGFLGYLILIRNIPGGTSFILLLLLIVWLGDAGAYYVGRLIGKRKLHVKVSPNKTIEGAIGGLIASLIGGGLAKLAFLPIFSWKEIFVLSFLSGLFGQLGDLTESMFKRSAGIKDSSQLIPAHGGLFDKLDGVAFAAPVFYYYLFWIKGYGAHSGF